MVAMMTLGMVLGSGATDGIKTLCTPKIVRLYDKTISSVVFIEVDTGSDQWGGKWCGSGVFIRPGLIITAGHVLGAHDPLLSSLDPNMLTVTTSDGRLLEVVEVFDENYMTADLGLLRVVMPEGYTPYYPKLDITTSVGEEIMVLGAPGGMYPMMTHGYIAGEPVDGMEPNSLNMQIDCAVNGGNSGGPMFDMDGDLIGIVVAKPGRVIGLAWCEQAEQVQVMLNNWKLGLTLPKAEREYLELPY